MSYKASCGEKGKKARLNCPGPAPKMGNCSLGPQPCIIRLETELETVPGHLSS